MSNLDKLIRIKVDKFEAYSPCKSSELLAERLGMSVADIIKVDANENPYGCSPKVLQALGQAQNLNIYVDAAQTEIRRQLAVYAGVSAENIVAGNGSDELIDLLMRLFVDTGDEVITILPTFDMYRFNTEVCCGKSVAVLRRPDFSVDVEAVRAAITKKTKMIFLASPNNPTGTVTSQEDILKLADTGLPLVIDEAYYEFYGQTVVPLVSRFDNLFVLRTFSKWAGLAGLRVGYGILPNKIAEYLLKIKPPYNVNAAALVAVRESLQEIAYLQETVKKLIAERARLMEKLQQISYLQPIPSQANFILCLVTKGNAKRIQQEMENRGILIRYYSSPLLKNYVRFSVGKPAQTERIIAELRRLEERING